MYLGKKRFRSKIQRFWINRHTGVLSGYVWIVSEQTYAEQEDGQIGFRGIARMKEIGFDAVLRDNWNEMMNPLEIPDAEIVYTLPCGADYAMGLVVERVLRRGRV